MKKNVIYILSVSFLILSCGTPKTLKQLGWSKGCPLERLNWMEASEGYDSKTMLEIATKLEAAVKSDLSAIKGDAKAKGELNSTLNDIVNKNGGGKIKVSQEFYEAYINKRSGICAVYQGIKDKIFTDDVAKSKAQELYLKLAESFSQIKSEEEKKNQ
ncbi:hypothetical protein [Flavobacterium microcysteis]|jgi:hypothetical protein|uniref:Lipoprotein n=1 Tax=Flavobacterium microcysteis TaxID=2596891 RepID=A0A501QBM5_9FLAO|nr:hypothetical protein [Flavobacterium microcysteis]TPD69764.1 hypothetical protein FJA49_07600 [Flavobacterium microcysteis]